MNYENNIAWNDPVTPIPEDLPELPAPVIDPNGWHWYPDSNGQLFTLYFDADGNECMMWQLHNDGSYYWRCANVGYTCRDIGIEDRRGIFFQNHLVGIMLLDNDLTVTWLPETYINNGNNDNINDYINYYNDYNNNIDINYNFTDVNDISDLDEDDTNDE